MPQWLQQWLANPEIQAMLARGQSTGSLTIQEVDAVVPESEFDMDQVSAVIVLLQDSGIRLVEVAEAEEPGDNPDSRP